jgi:hypothetical protein
MNIHEINNGTPRWWAVVATGLPLVLLTILVPLFFDTLFHTTIIAVRSRIVQSTGLILLSCAFILLFVSGYFPVFEGLHLEAIPILSILLYAARKWYAFWNQQPPTEWRFYCFFFLYTLCVGLLNEFLTNFILLPFFLSILCMLPCWWKRDRLKAWWSTRKETHEERGARATAASRHPPAGEND